MGDRCVRQHPQDLLQAYAHSVGDVDGAFPTQLINGLAQIVAEHAIVIGPENFATAEAITATAEESEDAKLPNYSNQCAAVFGGGIDDIAPIRICGAVVKKYKLAQKCDELVKLTRKDGSSKRAEVCRQRVIAIAAPVDALEDLHE